MMRPSELLSFSPIYSCLMLLYPPFIIFFGWWVSKVENTRKQTTELFRNFDGYLINRTKISMLLRPCLSLIMLMLMGSASTLGPIVKFHAALRTETCILTFDICFSYKNALVTLLIRCNGCHLHKNRTDAHHDTITNQKRGNEQQKNSDSNECEKKIGWFPLSYLINWYHDVVSLCSSFR